MAGVTTVLTQEHIQRYQHDGYLFLDGLYSADEVAHIRTHVPQLLAEGGARTVLETKKKSVRSVYGIHQNNEAIALLARHWKLGELAKALLGGDVYVYQSKINTKAAFDGDLWDWHQDYIFWKMEDGMPSSQVFTAALFLDEVTEFNGPLMLIPGSHRDGVLSCATAGGKPEGYDQSPQWISSLTAKIKYTVARDQVAQLAHKGGLVAPKGRAGSVLVFDGNTVHASQANISPFPRTVLLLTYNRVDNAPPVAGLRRPEFLASRDARPLQTVRDELESLFNA